MSHQQDRSALVEAYVRNYMDQHLSRWAAAAQPVGDGITDDTAALQARSRWPVAGDRVTGNTEPPSKRQDSCPCGGAPSQQFYPYCGYDCQPSRNRRESFGSAMRWRPDMVTEEPDDGLTPFAPRMRVGQFTGEIFDRAGAEPGTRRLHLRVDDGYRFVGADMVFTARELCELDLENDSRLQSKWAALCQELGMQRISSAIQGVSEQVRAALQQVAECARGLTPLIQLQAQSCGCAVCARARVRFERDEVQAETLRRVRAARNSGPPAKVRAPRRIDASRGR